jgi:hypothetical protein
MVPFFPLWKNRCFQKDEFGHLFHGCDVIYQGVAKGMECFCVEESAFDVTFCKSTYIFLPLFDP